MRRASYILWAALWGTTTAVGFDGRIHAELTRGGETNALLYSISADHLRVENTNTNWPHPVNLVDIKSGAVTLVFPHNRSFVQLSGAHAPTRVPADASSAGIVREARPTAPEAGALPIPQLPEMPAPPAGLPAGIGPQTGPAGGVPMMPAMPMIMEKLELKATGETTNLVGYACARYELKQRGETMEIWATDRLLPFQPWLRNQPARFGPRMIEEQWAEMLQAKGLFPLLAVLKYEHGPERLRFEVKSVKQEKITDPDGKLFQPPKDYHELKPLPF